MNKNLQTPITHLMLLILYMGSMGLRKCDRAERVWGWFMYSFIILSARSLTERFSLTTTLTSERMITFLVKCIQIYTRKGIIYDMI